MRRPPVVIVPALLAAVLAVVGPTAAQEPMAPTSPGEAPTDEAGGGSTEVVLVVTDAAEAAGGEIAADAAEVAGGELVDELAAPGLALVEVPAGAVDVLERQAGVVGVVDDAVVETAIHESVPLVGAPAVWASGADGAGQVVVVIDTGIDAGNPALAPALVGEACFAGAGTAPDNCRQEGGGGPLVSSSTGQGTATPCSRGGAGPYPTACLHGSAVAATVASRSSSRPGVAPGAGVYAIQVFDSSAGSATVVDLFQAFDHVVALVDGGMEVSAVNLSVATAQTFAGHCDDLDAQSLAYHQMFTALTARGVPVVVAAGNGGATGRISEPACVSNAVAVGATTLSDVVASFSNRSSALDILAPGAGASSGSTLTFPNLPSQAGTSFSAPHVAGALALLRDQFPRSLPPDRIGLLRRIGMRVAVAGVGTLPRLRVLPPSQALHGGVLFSGSAGVGGGSRAALGDLDGDGNDDIVSHGPGSSPDRISYGRGTSWSFASVGHSVAGSYVPLTGNFHGAVGGPADILWYAPGPAGDSLWTGSAGRTYGNVSVVVPGQPVPLLGDFDGDGFDDVLWYGPGTAPDSVWFGGPAGFAPVPLSIGGTYRPAVGDFDGDGLDDVFWHAPGASQDHQWMGTAGRSFTSLPRAVSGTYLPFVGDFDGDGRADLFWYAPGPAGDHVHYGNPDRTFASVSRQVSGTYQPLVGDFDGDGRDDVAWYAPGSVTDRVWFGRADRSVTSRSFSVSGTYQPLVGDFDGDGRDDIAWHTSTATVPVWWSGVV